MLADDYHRVGAFDALYLAQLPRNDVLDLLFVILLNHPRTASPTEEARALREGLGRRLSPPLLFFFFNILQH